MADLTDIQAAQSIKVIGSDATGLENNPVNATDAGALHVNLRDETGDETGVLSNPLHVSTSLSGGGVEGFITVGTSAVAARVGAFNLANRRVISIFNNGTTFVWWGLTSGVTVGTGTPLMRNQQLIYEADANTTIYLISNTASQNVRIVEGA